MVNVTNHLTLNKWKCQNMRCCDSSSHQFPICLASLIITKNSENNLLAHQCFTSWTIGEKKAAMKHMVNALNDLMLTNENIKAWWERNLILAHKFLICLSHDKMLLNPNAGLSILHSNKTKNKQLNTWWPMRCMKEFQSVCSLSLTFTFTVTVTVTVTVTRQRGKNVAPSILHLKNKQTKSRNETHG